MDDEMADKSNRIRFEGGTWAICGPLSNHLEHPSNLIAALKTL